MLNLSNAPFWLDLLPGLTVQMRPAGTAARLVARQEAQAAHADPEGDGRVAAHIAFVSILVKRNLLAWSGVGDSEGAPVEPTQDRKVKNDAGEIIEIIPGTISQLLENYEAFEAFDLKYVAPLLEIDGEKKGSSASQNGSSPKTAKPTAQAVAKAARRPAKRVRSKSTD